MQNEAWSSGGKRRKRRWEAGGRKQEAGSRKQEAEGLHTGRSFTPY